jgi:hypothetical protein
MLFSAILPADDGETHEPAVCRDVRNKLGAGLCPPAPRAKVVKDAVQDQDRDQTHEIFH